jgi:hypothetical protein
MTRENAFEPPEDSNSFHTYRHSTVGHNVFDATGGSDEPAAWCQPPGSEDHERFPFDYTNVPVDFDGARSNSILSNHEVVRNVEGRCVDQGWQQGASTHGTANPDWIEDPNAMSYSQASTNGEASQHESIPSYYSQSPDLPYGLSSMSWARTGQPRHRPCIQYTCNAVPVITVESPSDENKAGGLSRGDASTLDSCTISTWSPWQRFGAVEPEEGINGHWVLHPSSYRQPINPVESAPSQYHGRSPGYTPTFAGVYVRPAPNNRFE